MKVILGMLFLAAGQTISSHAFAIRSLDTAPVRRGAAWGRFNPRQEASTIDTGYTDTTSIDLNTVFGTANFTLTTFDVLSTGTSTALVTNTTSDTSQVVGIVTVTTTAIEIVTATATADPTISLESNNSTTVAFGGRIGQVIETNAPTAGATITIGGDDSFGGAVGVISSDSSDVATTTQGTSTSVEVITATAVTVVTVTGDSFGGVVGIVVDDSTDTIATTTSFAGFGGVPGSAVFQNTATTSSAYVKRDTFTTSVNVTNGQASTLFEFPN
jgi:hypothetical protein